MWTPLRHLERHYRAFRTIDRKYRKQKNVWSAEVLELADYYERLDLDERKRCERFMISEIQDLLGGGSRATGHLGYAALDVYEHLKLLHLSAEILKTVQDAGPPIASLSEKTAHFERDMRRLDAIRCLLAVGCRNAIPEAVAFLERDREVFHPDGLLSFLAYGRGTLIGALFAIDPPLSIRYAVEYFKRFTSTETLEQTMAVFSSVAVAYASDGDMRSIVSLLESLSVESKELGQRAARMARKEMEKQVSSNPTRYARTDAVETLRRLRELTPDGTG